MNDQLIAREISTRQKILSRIGGVITRFRRKYIPYLVFYGQEVDVLVTWKENKLPKNISPEHGLQMLNTGHLAKIEQMIGDIGIGFDKGLGFEGRDWEWDWSLNGPINVKFRRPCKTVERRQ